MTDVIDRDESQERAARSDRRHEAARLALINAPVYARVLNELWKREVIGEDGDA